MIGPDMYDRTICYDDLATGGAMMVFGPERNLLEVAHYFMEFFNEESCGYCTPCRVGNVLLQGALENHAGQGRTRGPDLPRGTWNDRQIHQPLRPRTDLAEPDSLHAEKFPAAVRGARQGKSERLPVRTSTSTKALTESSAIAGRPSMHFAE
jgi:hypothetical protein